MSKTGKKRGVFQKILSIVLSLTMIIPMIALSGCEQNYNQLKKEKVQFNKSGEYTVSFKESDLLDVLDNGDVQDTSAKPAMEFKDITQDDVTVKYDYITDEAVNDAEGNPTDELKIEAKTTEISKFDNSGSEITLTFKDDSNFANNASDNYTVYIEKAKSVVIVEPQLPDNTLSSNTKSVSSDDTENTIVIESKEGKFNPSITKDNITLDYSFKDMQISSLEAKDKKLTIKLSGKPVIIPEISSVFTAGEIEIAPEGFEKAVYPEEITFDIKSPIVTVDTENITESKNGRWNVPINVDGVDVSNIKAEDISFGENTKVTDIDKKNGQIVAEVETDNIDELGGPMKVGDKEYLSSFAHASVYIMPFWEDKEDDNYVLTIGIFPNNGKISKDIDKSQIKLVDGFAAGSITRLDRYEEDDLESIVIDITLPSNGASLEEMNIMGTLEFEEGALIEDWGDKAPGYFISANYNHNFFQIAGASDEGMADGEKIDLTSLFTTVAYAAEPANNDANNNNENNANNNNANNNANNANNNNANNNANNANNNNANNNANNANNNANNNAKKLTESELALKNQRKNDNKWKAAGRAVDYAAEKLSNVNDTAATVAKYCKIIYNLGKGIYTENPADIVEGVIGLIEVLGIFDKELDPNNPSNKSLNDKIDDISVLLNAMDQKLDTVIKNQYKQMTQAYENALDALKTDCLRAESMLQGAKDIYVSQGNKVPDKNAGADELKAYNAALVKIIIDEEKKGNAGFRGYSTLISRIENNYILVTTETSKTWDKNPIFYNDSCWSQYFNFDSQGYYLREAYRANVKYQISRAYGVLSFYYEIPANAQRYNDLTMRMKNSIETIDAHPSDPKPTDGSAKVNNSNNYGYPNQNVYSSTFKKTVTGMYFAANGVTDSSSQIEVGRWLGNPVKNITTPYKYDRNTYNQYVKKLHGKSVWDDLKLAFPYVDTAKGAGKNFGDGIGFGGGWTKSKFRFEATGIFNFHDWIWYEQILTWDGKFNSYKTYDTINKKNPRKTYMRFNFK